MEGGKIIQVGTSEEILKNPENDYVKAFFRGVDPSQILNAGDILRKDTQVTIIRHPGDGLRVALQRLINYDRDFGYVVDKDRRFLGAISTENLKEHMFEDQKSDLSELFYPELTPVNISQPMLEALEQVIKYPFPAPVIDDDMKFRGVISKNSFLKSIYQNKVEEKTDV